MFSDVEIVSGSSAFRSYVAVLSPLASHIGVSIGDLLNCTAAAYTNKPGIGYPSYENIELAEVLASTMDPVDMKSLRFKISNGLVEALELIDKYGLTHPRPGFFMQYVLPDTVGAVAPCLKLLDKFQRLHQDSTRTEVWVTTTNGGGTPVRIKVTPFIHWLITRTSRTGKVGISDILRIKIFPEIQRRYLPGDDRYSTGNTYTSLVEVASRFGINRSKFLKVNMAIVLAQMESSVEYIMPLQGVTL